MFWLFFRQNFFLSIFSAVREISRTFEMLTPQPPPGRWTPRGGVGMLRFTTRDSPRPLVFHTFINDMPISVSSSKNRLFADDAIIYKTVKARSDVDILQKCITSLEKWEKHRRMEFNPSKCHSISFNRLRNPITHTYSLHQTPLEQLSSPTYV